MFCFSWWLGYYWWWQRARHWRRSYMPFSNGLRKAFHRTFGLAENLLSNKKAKLSYITEDSFWVISYVGGKLISGLSSSGFKQSRITTTHLGLRNQIVHFGSVNTFLKKNGFARVHKSNRVILTWFHFVPGLESNKNILPAQGRLSFIHTSCNITKNKLVEQGVSPQKIIVIPLGVDLALFKPALPEEKQKLKEELGIPPDKIVIGSFQKDGIGWGEGLTPKLEKGPDIFVKAVERLARDYPVFVLLAGPARGYVKRELRKRDIAFRAVGFLDKVEEVARYYNVLDLYLITSRIEGGPQAILESMASKVPVVSTKVGLVQDIVENGREALLADVEDVDQIVSQAKSIIENQDLKNRLVTNGFNKVQHYSWDKIAQAYLREMYSKLL